ncbi:MAG: hypothetical protein CV090_06520 [Nitrospira sp. WS238]|nr:hypothetical protein [Nitrospira sp. WS238]
MTVLAILLSLTAITMAYVALQRTGGLKDLKLQMDHLTNKTEDVAKGARETTADILQRLEHVVRGSGAQPPESGAQPSDKQENVSPPPPTGSQT